MKRQPSAGAEAQYGEENRENWKLKKPEQFMRNAANAALLLLLSSATRRNLCYNAIQYAKTRRRQAYRRRASNVAIQNVTGGGYKAVGRQVVGTMKYGAGDGTSKAGEHA
jgi:hypothetical protein